MLSQFSFVESFRDSLVGYIRCYYVLLDNRSGALALICLMCRLSHYTNKVTSFISLLLPFLLGVIGMVARLLQTIMLW